MKFKREYKCILYEEGDVVFPKYPDAKSKPKTIIGTRLDILGTNTVTQFLQFENEDNDLNVSNYFIPYGEETRAKYQDGLVHFESFNKETGKIVTTSATKVIYTEKKSKSNLPSQNEILFRPVVKPQ